MLLNQSWEMLKIIILLPDIFIHQLEFFKSHKYFIQILNFDKLFQVCFV